MREAVLSEEFVRWLAMTIYFNNFSVGAASAAIAPCHFAAEAAPTKKSKLFCASTPLAGDKKLNSYSLLVFCHV